jgi:hypothetical protein
MKNTLESLGIRRFDLVLELSVNRDARRAAYKDNLSEGDVRELVIDFGTLTRALNRCIDRQEAALEEVKQLDKVYYSFV